MIPADGSAAGSLSYAAGQAARRTTGWHNQCLRYVRSAFGAPARGGSARTAWAAAQHKHPKDRNPPAGVGLFFAGGTYGHTEVARHEGRSFSTDTHVDGQARACSIAHTENLWGMTYLGWTEDVNGKRLENIGLPQVTLATVKHRIAHDKPYVGFGTIARALHAKGYKGFTNGSKWGRGKKRAYAKWQKQCGFKGDGIPGARSLALLGRNHKHGFTVR